MLGLPVPSTWKAGSASLPGSKGRGESWEELQAKRLEVARLWEKGRSQESRSKVRLEGRRGGDRVMGGSFLGTTPEDTASEHLFPDHLGPIFFSQDL